VDTANAERAPLARELGATDEPAGFVSLLALDETPHPRHPALPAGLTATTVLIQALADAAATAPLYCLTQGAVATSPTDPLPNPLQAQAWGLGRVAALEYPRLWGGLIDLPPVLDRHTGGRLAALLRPDHPEDQTAIRATGIMARRLGHAPLTSAPEGGWEPTGTTLITGGTGGIGALLARRLADRGADHLLLVSRRGPDAPGTEELTTELTGLGAKVTVAACDVADRDQLRAVLDDLPAEHPLTSVVHAAGVPGYTAIGDLSIDDLNQVVRPKAHAATHLHELTRDLDLRAFVLFSSGAASWGSGQQAAYGAANTYLDALAEHRRAQGLPATSVAWGPWSEAGMSADKEALAFFRRFGLLPLTTDLALQALDQAVANDDTTLTVAGFDWDQFTPTFTAQRPSPFLADLPENRQPAASQADEATTSALREELAGTAPAKQSQVLLKHVQKHAAATLGHASPDAIPATKPFQELGFDSLTAVQIRNDLNASTGLRLPTTVIFDHPTPQELADYLRGQLLDDDAVTEGTILSEVDRWDAACSAGAVDDAARRRIAGRLQVLLTKWNDAERGAERPSAHSELESATADDIFDLISNEFGKS
jgi:polyketide synthase 7